MKWIVALTAGALLTPPNPAPVAAEVFRHLSGDDDAPALAAHRPRHPRNFLLGDTMFKSRSRFLIIPARMRQQEMFITGAHEPHHFSEKYVD